MSSEQNMSPVDRVGFGPGPGGGKQTNSVTGTAVELPREPDLEFMPGRTRFLNAVRDRMSNSRNDNLAVLLGRIEGFSRVEQSLGYRFSESMMVNIFHQLRKEADEDVFLTPFQPGMIAGLLDGGNASERTLELGAFWRRFLPDFSREQGLPHALRGNAGIALFPDHSRDADKLVCRAHRALDYAETSQEKSVQLFVPDLLERADRLVGIERDFERTLHGEELELVYQPRVELTDHTVTGVEALLRWNHPIWGQVPPKQILNLAHRAGLSFELDRFVMRSVFDQLRTWQGCSETAHLEVFLNLTHACFLPSNDFVSELRRLLKQYNVPPEKIELEVTEQHAMGDISRTVGVLKQVREMGVRVTLDDFGTGYSSLEYMIRFPLDVVKVDRSYVSGIDRNKSSQKLVSSIVDLARDFDLEVVGEGTEQREEVDFLERLGCDYTQGYYYSKPLPVAEIEQLLRDGIQARR